MISMELPQVHIAQLFMLSDKYDRFLDLLPQLPKQLGITLLLVAGAMLIGGFFGLILGTVLYATRPGNLLENRLFYNICNLLVNIFRPIPFILLLALLQPVARAVIGTGIGNQMGLFAMSFMATFGIARLVEQNLVTVPAGVVEAARAAGAGRMGTLIKVVIPEGLGPLILGYTFAFIAVVDASAMVSAVGGDGIGYFALQYGYRQSNPWVSIASVLLIIVLVQLIQLLGNTLARKVMRRG